MHRRGISYLLIFALLCPSLAHADVIPPGHKYIHCSAQLDLGSYREHSWLSYTIQKHDTLSGIAKKVLKAGFRWEEIEKANPRVKAKNLKIGTKLVIPPKTSFVTKDHKKIPVKTWRFYWWPDPSFGRSKPTLVGSDGSLGPTRYSGLIVGVPTKNEAAFSKALEDKDKEAWKKVTGVVWSKQVNVGRSLVADDSNATSMISKLKIEGLKGRSIKLGTKNIYKDKRGKTVAANTTIRGPLVAASGCGIALLAAFALFRRRKTPDIKANSEREELKS